MTRNEIVLFSFFFPILFPPSLLVEKMARAFAPLIAVLLSALAASTACAQYQASSGVLDTVNQVVPVYYDNGTLAVFNLTTVGDRSVVQTSVYTIYVRLCPDLLRL